MLHLCKVVEPAELEALIVTDTIESHVAQGNNFQTCLIQKKKTQKYCKSRN